MADFTKADVQRWREGEAVPVTHEDRGSSWPVGLGIPGMEAGAYLVACDSEDAALFHGLGGRCTYASGLHEAFSDQVGKATVRYVGREMSPARERRVARLANLLKRLNEDSDAFGSLVSLLRFKGSAAALMMYCPVSWLREAVSAALAGGWDE